ncbi:MAG TPA: hypothetical protein VD997_18145 [Phycisphaerales bacterium]|nr:hypothetical protein [Phycisphaerales bacterium]
MTLREAIDNADRLPDDAVIFATDPWNADAAVHLFKNDDEGSAAPRIIDGRSFSYFLEVDIMRDFIKTLRSSDFPRVQVCERVIYYATYDA